MKVIRAGVIAVFIVLAGACASQADGPGTVQAADDDSEQTETTRRTTTTQRTTTTVPEPVLPTPADFSINLFTQSNQCFGSAGCLVEVVPEITYLGAVFTYDLPVRITYQIDGDESGPVIKTITLQPSGSYDQDSTLVSTPDSSVTPTATITAVR